MADIETVNLGRWILRYLFSRLIDEEIKRDEAHRQKLNESAEKRLATPHIETPASLLGLVINGHSWNPTGSPVTTPRANDSNLLPTPGLGIGVATPSAHLPGVPEKVGTPLSSVDKRSSQTSRQSGEDYFSTESLPPMRLTKWLQHRQRSNHKLLRPRSHQRKQKTRRKTAPSLRAPLLARNLGWACHLVARRLAGQHLATPRSR